MPLTITAVASPTQCDHLQVTVNHEGTTRKFQTSLADIDALVEELGGPLEATRKLVMIWAGYRRVHGRPVVDVVIA